MPVASSAGSSKFNCLWLKAEHQHNLKVYYAMTGVCFMYGTACCLLTKYVDADSAVPTLHESYRLHAFLPTTLITNVGSSVNLTR